MTATNNQMTIFVSYAHADSEWVIKKLLPRLEAARLQTIIDFRDFKPGAMSIEEMERAVLKSDYTIVVLSEQYVQSEWCTFESVMTQTLDPSARRRRLIPLLRQKCDIPLRLRILHFRDVTDDSEEQWRRFEGDLQSLSPC
jgi:hypothetical protein